MKLIKPKDLPDQAEGIEAPRIKRLIEKVIEAKKEKKDSLDADQHQSSRALDDADCDRAQ